METEIVDHLLALSASSSKTTKEFEGFEKTTDMEPVPATMEIEDSRVPETVTPPSAKMHVPKIKRGTGHFKDSDIKLLVTQVVDQLAPTIKSMAVTENIMKIQVKYQA